MFFFFFFCKGQEGELVYSNKVQAPSGWSGRDGTMLNLSLCLVFDSLPHSFTPTSSGIVHTTKKDPTTTIINLFLGIIVDW